MNAIDPLIFHKTRVVWARKHVYINGEYSEDHGFLNVIQSCKMMDIPVITTGDVVDQEYFKSCFDEGWGATLKKQTVRTRNDFYSLAKIYVCNISHEEASISERLYDSPRDNLNMVEAMKCGCLILCSSLNKMAYSFPRDGFWVYDHHDLHDFEEKLWYAYRQDRMVQENTSWWEIDWSSKIYL